MECGEAVVIDDLYVPYEPAAVRHVLSEAELASVQSRRFIDLLAVSQASRVPVETLVSLHAQRVVKAAKQNSTAHKRKAGAMVQQYRQGQSLLSVAHRNGIAPCMLARLVLVAECGTADKREVSALLKNVAAIEMERLRDEVRQCIAEDRVYSPLVERLKEHVGTEWEHHLARRLDMDRLMFKTEDEMRAEGFAKTPDVFFQLPHLVTLASGEQVVALWIDSKASFGGRDALLQGLREQLTSYRMRFGPGVVVFWFGHAAEHRDIMHERGIAVTHRILGCVPAE